MTAARTVPRIHRRTGDRLAIATLLNALGEAARAAGDPAAAIDRHTEAFAIATEIDGTMQQARAPTS